jgi:hypothetical protein
VYGILTTWSPSQEQVDSFFEKVCTVMYQLILKQRARALKELIGKIN